MESLYPSLALWIAKIGKFTIRDCVNWSRTSRSLHQIAKEIFYHRLTEKQNETVTKILKLNNVLWGRNCKLYNGREIIKFHPSYVVSTGTSTGKTLIALAAASEYIRAGKNVAIVVQARLFAQWSFESKKFSPEVYLAPLETKETWTRGKILLMERNLVNKKMPKVSWDLVIFDEETKIPKFMREPDFKGFGVLLSASMTGNTIAKYAKDPELGALPSLTVDCYFTKRAMEENEDFYMKNYMIWIERLIDEKNGKTLILTHDKCMYKNKLTKLDKRIQIPNAYSLGRCKGPKEKGEVVSQWQKSGGILFSGSEYLAKGFNLPCNVLMMFDLEGKISIKSLHQIIGRIRRVYFSIKYVKVIFITSSTESWKLFACLNRNSINEIFTAATNISEEGIAGTGAITKSETVWDVKKISLKVDPGDYKRFTKITTVATPIKIHRVFYEEMKSAIKLSVDDYVFGGYSADDLYKQKGCDENSVDLYRVIQIVFQTSQTFKVYRVLIATYCIEDGIISKHGRKGNFVLTWPKPEDAIQNFCDLYLKATGNEWHSAVYKKSAEPRYFYHLNPRRHDFVAENLGIDPKLIFKRCNEGPPFEIITAHKLKAFDDLFSRIYKKREHEEEKDQSPKRLKL
jgi:hypothetical protein